MYRFGCRNVVSVRSAHASSKMQLGARRTARADEGFTLVELLIVIVILPIIVGAIAFALVSLFSLQNGTANRLANSGDAQTVSATFEKDVQSAGQVTTDGSIATGCGSTGTQLLGLQWSLNGQPIIVSYVETGTTAPFSLVRNYCTSGTITNSSIVSFNLSADPLPATQLPTFTCPAAQSNCAVTAASSWISTLGVSDVTWSFDETNTNTSTGSFLYRLIATPRLYRSEPPAAQGEPLYPLTLLASNCASGPPLDMTGASTLTAQDSSGNLLPIRIEASCASAITLIPGQTLTGQVGGIVTSDQNTTVPGTDTYCVLNNKNGSTCNPSQVGPPETYQAPSADPLSVLTAPSNPTLPSGCLNVACSQGEEFSAAQSLVGPNFGVAGKTYIFDQNVTISNNVSVTFASGTYWFKDGLSMAQSNVTFGQGTYLFGTAADACPSQTCLSKTNGGTMSTTASGALFYVEAGMVTFNGSSQVSILGESDAADYALYGGVAIWDVSTMPFAITAGAGTNSTYGGIYCPNGQLVISGSGNMTIPFVDANSASLTGSGGLAIG
jgi:prepilin-type N-terminal cleavage/methylation domain-containing protein